MGGGGCLIIQFEIISFAKSMSTVFVLCLSLCVLVSLPCPALLSVVFMGGGRAAAPIRDEVL